jgi:hypothetical protein
VKCEFNDPGQFPNIFLHILHKYSNCSFPIPFLVLSGRSLSQIEFYDSQKLLCRYDPIYVDNLGIPDIFFSRGKNITLSSERLEKCIDFILSSNDVFKSAVQPLFTFFHLFEKFFTNLYLMTLRFA